MTLHNIKKKKRGKKFMDLLQQNFLIIIGENGKKKS